MTAGRQPGTGRIVVGVDGSSAAQDALRWAYRQAARGGVGLHLISTYELDGGHSPYHGSYAYVPDGRTAAHLSEAESKWREERFQQAQHRAEAMIRDEVAAVRAQEPGEVDVTDEVVGGSRPAELLIKRSEGAEMLVVGSRGLGGFKGLLLGSVSQQCVQHAACPVVVVRHPRE